MLQDILQQARNELINGYVKKGHPFRYFTFVTSKEHFPKARTVVLRKMKPNFEIVFFTDARSKKIEEIEKNLAVCALFYHPKKLLQIKISGKAHLINDEEVLKDLWSSIPENSRKDYTTNLPPGTPIKNPDLVEYRSEHNFCAVTIKAEKIEVLQLKRPNHVRAVFEFKENNWHGQFLVP